MKKAQISMEYLMIFGIGLTLVLVLGSLFFSFSGSQRDELSTKQIERILSDLQVKGEQMYFRGEGNKISYKANFPDGIINFSIHWVNESGTFYSYFNVTEQISGATISHLSTLSEGDILFACSNCNNDSSIEKSFWYNYVDYSQGPKTLTIEATNNQVEFNFVK